MPFLIHDCYIEDAEKNQPHLFLLKEVNVYHYFWWHQVSYQS